MARMVIAKQIACHGQAPSLKTAMCCRRGGGTLPYGMSLLFFIWKLVYTTVCQDPAVGVPTHKTRATIQISNTDSKSNQP